MNKIIKNSDSNNNTMIILKGFLISIIVTLVLIFILAMIVSYTDFSEENIGAAIIGVTAISILIGTSISTIRLNKNGLLNGGAIASIYMLSLYIISSGIGTGFSLNLNAVIMMILGIIAGMLGGIVGVNLKFNK